MSSIPFVEPLLEPTGKDAGGFQEVIGLPTPAAGAGVTYQNPGAYVTRPVCITFVLSASIAVANRYPFVQYQTVQGDIIGAAAAQAAHVAGESAFYSFTLGGSSGGSPAAGGVVIPLPEAFLEPTRIIAIDVGGMDVADQIGGVFLTLDRYYTDPRTLHPAARRGRRAR